MFAQGGMCAVIAIDSEAIFYALAAVVAIIILGHFLRAITRR